jgi:hypothetical protein
MELVEIEIAVFRTPDFCCTEKKAGLRVELSGMRSGIRSKNLLEQLHKQW